MIKCLIVDDEPLALDIMEGYVKNTSFLKLVGKASGVPEALKQMHLNEVDLLFLDIQMPGMSGIEFSQTLTTETKIVFTTAFAQYALDGFKVNALGYLLKPFSYAEFLDVAHRADEWFTIMRPAGEPVQPADSLFVKSEYKIIRIKFAEIQYIEGLKDYVKFYLTGRDRPILSLMSLKMLEEALPSHQFMRIHRSYIINLDKIQTIQRNEILFGKVGVPIADKYKEKFQKFLHSRTPE